MFSFCRVAHGPLLVKALVMSTVLALCCACGQAAPAQAPSSRTDVCALQTQRPSLTAARGRRQTGGDEYSRWAHGVIPYSLDASLSRGGRQMRKLILRAMLVWSRKTSLIFVPRTTQDDFVRIAWGRRCCSMRGRQGGEQTLQIGKRCNSQISVLHHIGHMAGLDIHGPQLDRARQAQNQLPGSVDAFHRHVQQQANPGSSVMMLKYHTVSSKMQRRMASAKLTPGKFDVLAMSRLYSNNRCGGRRPARPLRVGNASAPGSRLTSPDFPDWYWADVDCAWHVASPAGQRVVLQRQFVSLEHSHDCQFDYIEVSDVGTGESTRYCGMDFPETLISSSRFGFTIQFHSDSRDQAKGFHLNFYSIVDGCQSQAPACGHRCVQRVDGPVCACPDGQRLWKDARTCVADERCGTPAGRCEHGCRLEAGGFPTCTCMQGFVLADDGISCKSCIHNITIGEPGRSASPHFPNNYSRDSECEWHIRSADPNKQVVIIFDVFRLEPGQGGVCRKDYLDVFFHPDEQYAASEAYAPFRFCGYFSQRPVTLTSHTSFVKMRLRTDSSGEYPGFSFRYTVQSPPAGPSDEEMARQNS